MEEKGSEWRIWDLHVHSPATYGGDYVTFISNVEKCKADAIGINDYCTLEGYRMIKEMGITGKVIFPVVEFRMHNIIANRKNTDPTKSGTKINFHIIFDNDPTLFNKISTWLNSLECFDDKGSTIHLGTASDLMKVTFDFEKVRASLKTLNLFDHCLIWLPYDEYGGIDEIDPNDNFFKLSLINKVHVMGSSSKNQIAFFKWEDPKITKEQYKEWFDKPKPCIKGSDAHTINYPFGHLQNHLSQPIDKFCWINADLTFQGLKQIVIEPDRVFIGEEPDLITRVKGNPTKFIKSISVNKISGASISDTWFEDFHVDLNSGLIAVIGNKGGGKSAITDIIGLCGNTHQDVSNFSFLTTAKFRKSKPVNLSERFEATMTWHDGTKSIKKLNENPDKNSPERVKYIPQNFLERLCANVESDEFEKELKQIIYSHTPPEERLGMASLDDLIAYKSGLVINEISQLQIDLAAVNIEIASLENKATKEYKNTIDNKLKLKKDELTAHLQIQPQKPVAGQSDEASTLIIQKLTTLREQITILEKEILQLRSNKTNFTIQQEELNRTFQFYNNLDQQLKKASDESNEFYKILVKNQIVPTEIFEYKIDLTQVLSKIETIKQSISTIDSGLNEKNDKSKIYLLNTLNTQLQQEQEELDKPAKEQQKYLDDSKNWENQKNIIEGNIGAEGSLKFLENQVEYLDKTLQTVLNGKYEERKKFLKELFGKKIKLVSIRKELFEPVTKFIDEFKELKAKYDVKLDAILELRNFNDLFFNYINQGRVGTFGGKEEGYKILSDIAERAHFDTEDGFISFFDELIDSLTHDKRYKENSEIDITTQLKKGVELTDLYNYLSNAEYLQPIYNLKLGSKTLQELSPGERGALLLIFYLLLDKDDIPLVIDQPEENLDNESVYHILVHFIKKVKEHRQIIIVTHNPNLAVVCDADQLIHMHIEKENKNTVKRYCGAIEDKTMNECILNILEGTLPAFNNRDSKYIR